MDVRPRTSTQRTNTPEAWPPPPGTGTPMSIVAGAARDGHTDEPHIGEHPTAAPAPVRTPAHPHRRRRPAARAGRPGADRDRAAAAGVQPLRPRSRRRVGGHPAADQPAPADPEVRGRGARRPARPRGRLLARRRPPRAHRRRRRRPRGGGLDGPHEQPGARRTALHPPAHRGLRDARPPRRLPLRPGDPRGAAPHGRRASASPPSTAPCRAWPTPARWTCCAPAPARRSTGAAPPPTTTTTWCAARAGTPSRSTGRPSRRGRSGSPSSTGSPTSATPRRSSACAARARLSPSLTVTHRGSVRPAVTCPPVAETDSTTEHGSPDGRRRGSRARRARSRVRGPAVRAAVLRAPGHGAGRPGERAGAGAARRRAGRGAVDRRADRLRPVLLGPGGRRSPTPTSPS